MTHEEMMGMLAIKDPCADPPAMSFHPDNPTELSPDSEQTLNLIGGVPPYTFDVLQCSLFYIDDSYISWAPEMTGDFIKATSYFSADFQPIYSHVPVKPRHGGYATNEWLSASGNPTNQRWNIDLGEAKIVNQIMLENSHHFGSPQTSAIKNFDLQGSNDANSLAQVDYSSDLYWTDIQTGLQAAQHSGVDFDDPQIIDITNNTAYRYYSLKIADNWGHATAMGFRHVQFHTSQEKVYKYITNTPQIIIKAPSYALWTARIKVTDLCDQEAEAWLYSSAGKWVSVYSYGGGGTPTLCGKETFRAIKNGVMFEISSCNTNDIGTYGDQECDCSAHGGGIYQINISDVCQGGEPCDHCQAIEYWCWPYP